VGHGECEAACPNHAISLVFGTKTRGMDIPRITTDYETNVPGLYIAGELGGMGLIRNAVKQGHLAAKHALSQVKPGVKADTNLLIVGAGPAGLSAALTAIAGKKNYICIEQNSFGGTVYNFPRQKVVMTYPADLPGVGKMKFPRNEVSKEELLEYWSGVRSKTGLKVKEKVAFQGVEQKGEVFEVKTSTGVITAQKVILAMGVRGSPRKLGLPNEDLPKVAYNLIDPEQYIGKAIAVVGGGNAGLEAAQALGNPKFRNKVVILVRGPEFDRCNAENKRITLEMEQKGQLSIQYSTVVKEITKDQIVIEGAKGKKTLKNDFLFVFAGAEMPHKFLMGLGIAIDKKFGEALRKA
jgi:thioredoxin reductase